MIIAAAAAISRPFILFLFILFLLTFVFVTVQAPSLPVELVSPGRAALCPRSVPGYTEVLRGDTFVRITTQRY